MCVTTSVGGLTVAIVTNIVLTYPILRNLRPSPCIQGKFNCRTSSQVICQGTDLVLAINNFGPRYASGTQESQSLQNSQCPKTKPCRYNISLLQCFFPECWQDNFQCQSFAYQIVIWSYPSFDGNRCGKTVQYVQYSTYRSRRWPACPKRLVCTTFLCYISYTIPGYINDQRTEWLVG